MISCDVCEMGFTRYSEACVHVRRFIEPELSIYRKVIAGLEKRLTASERDNLVLTGDHARILSALIYDNRILDHRFEVLRRTLLHLLAGIALDEDLSNYVNTVKAELAELERSGYIPINLRIKDQ